MPICSTVLDAKNYPAAKITATTTTTTTLRPFFLGPPRWAGARTSGLYGAREEAMHPL